MTNKEKFKEVFGLEIDDTSDCGFFDCSHRACDDCPVKDTEDWWNAEYKQNIKRSEGKGMTDYKKYINALRKCAKERENDRTLTGSIVVSALCKDTANLLEALEQEPFINKPCVSSGVCEHDKNKVLDKIREQMKDYLRGVEITLEILVENDPLRPKMEGAKDTLEECLKLIDKAEAEADNG